MKYYPEYEFYTNLLPVYATPKQLFGAFDGEGYTYPDYVSRYVEEVNPPSLSYDHYPICKTGMRVRTSKRISSTI